MVTEIVAGTVRCAAVLDGEGTNTFVHRNPSGKVVATPSLSASSQKLTRAQPVKEEQIENIKHIYVG